MRSWRLLLKRIRECRSTDNGEGISVRTFESLLYIHSFLCASLKVRNGAFRLAESHCSFWRYHSLILLHIDFVTQHDLEISFNEHSLISAKDELTKGKFSGSLGLACIKNSSLQLSKVSKLFELLTS